MRTAHGIHDGSRRDKIGGDGLSGKPFGRLGRVGPLVAKWSKTRSRNLNSRQLVDRAPPMTMVETTLENPTGLPNCIVLIPTFSSSSSSSSS
eukprot:9129323-Pyramimonas_sp.AAC.1